MKSQASNRTLYGVEGLSLARKLFGSARLAKCNGRYHPSDGSLFQKLSVDGAEIIPEPPFFKSTPEKEFDEYYDGAWGWN